MLDTHHSPSPAVQGRSVRDAFTPSVVDDTTADDATPFALFARGKGGDALAVEEFFRKVLPGLTRWAAQRMPPGLRASLDASDVAQDAALVFFRRWELFVPHHERAVEGYLRKIVANRITDEIRKSLRRGPSSLPSSELPAHDATPLERAVTAERLCRYRRALRSLSREDAALVDGRFRLELSYADLAKRHGKPTSDAARMALRRAVRRLRAEMEEVAQMALAAAG